MTMQPQDQPLSEDRLRFITEPPPLLRNDRKARKELAREASRAYNFQGPQQDN